MFFIIIRRAIYKCELFHDDQLLYSDANLINWHWVHIYNFYEEIREKKIKPISFNIIRAKLVNIYNININFKIYLRLYENP